jgi:uncharacterized membrane protein SirB2
MTALIQYYSTIKGLHVGTALTSGTLFFARGLAVQAGQRWPMRTTLRYLSYAIDTFLLASAILLLTILPGAALANHWLAVKLALVASYVVFGTLALRRARTAAMRRICFAIACLIYATILDVALTHDPLGPLRLLLR